MWQCPRCGKFNDDRYPCSCGERCANVPLEPAPSVEDTYKRVKKKKKLKIALIITAVILAIIAVAAICMNIYFSQEQDEYTRAMYDIRNSFEDHEYDWCLKQSYIIFQAGLKH